MILKNKLLAAYTHARHISYHDLIANLALALIWSGTWHTAILSIGLMLSLKLMLPSSVETSPKKKYFYQNLLRQLVLFGCMGVSSVFLIGLCFNIVVAPVTIHVALFSFGIIQSHCLHRSRSGHFWGIALGTFIFASIASTWGLLATLGCSVTLVSASVIALTALKLERSYFSLAMRGLLFLSVLSIEFGLWSCAIAMIGCWLIRGLLYKPQLNRFDRKQHLSVYDISDCINEVLNADNRWHLPFGYVVPSDQQMSPEQSLKILHQCSRFCARLIPSLPQAYQQFEWQVYALFHAMETAKNLNRRTQGEKLSSNSPANSPRTNQPVLHDDHKYMQLIDSLIGDSAGIYEAYFGVVLSTYMPQKRYQKMPPHPRLAQDLILNQINSIQNEPIVNRHDIIISSEIIRQICFEAKPGPDVVGAPSFQNHCVAMMALNGQKTEASSRWGQHVKKGEIVPAQFFNDKDEMPQVFNQRWGQERYSIWSVVFRYGLRLGQELEHQKAIRGRRRANSENLMIDIYSWLSPCDKVLVLLQLDQEANHQELSDLERNLSYSIIEWFIPNDEHEILRSDELRAVAWQILHSCPTECSGLINLQDIQEKIFLIKDGRKPLEKRNELWGVLLFSACQILANESYLNKIKFTYEPPEIRYTINQLHRFIELSCIRKNTILQKIALSLLHRLVREQVNSVYDHKDLNKVSMTSVNDFVVLQEESTKLRRALNGMDETIRQEIDFIQLIRLIPLNLSLAIQAVSDLLKSRAESNYATSPPDLVHQARSGVNTIIIHMYSGVETNQDQSQKVLELLKLMIRTVDIEGIHTPIQTSRIGKVFLPNESIESGQILLLQHLIGILLKFRDQAFLKLSLRGAYTVAGWWHEKTKDALLTIGHHALDIESTQKRIMLQSTLLSVIAYNDKFRYSSPETIEMSPVYDMMIFFDEPPIDNHFKEIRHCGLLRGIILKAIQNVQTNEAAPRLRGQSFIFLMSLIERTRPGELDLILNDELETIVQVLFRHAPINVLTDERQQDIEVTSDEVFGAVMSLYTRVDTMDTTEFDQNHFTQRVGRILDMSLGTYYKVNGITATPEDHSEMPYLQKCMFKWLAELDRKSEVSMPIKSSLDKWFMHCSSDPISTTEESAYKKQSIMKKITSMMPEGNTMTQQQKDHADALLEDLQNNMAHALNDQLTVSGTNTLFDHPGTQPLSGNSSFLKSQGQRRRSNSMIPTERKNISSRRSNSISGELRSERKNADSKRMKKREEIETEIDKAIGERDVSVLRTLSRAMGRINQTQFRSEEDKDIFEHHDVYGGTKQS